MHLRTRPKPIAILRPEKLSVPVSSCPLLKRLLRQIYSRFGVIPFWRILSAFLDCVTPRFNTGPLNFTVGIACPVYFQREAGTKISRVAIAPVSEFDQRNKRRKREKPIVRAPYGDGTDACDQSLVDPARRAAALPSV